MISLSLSVINVIAELESFNIPYNFASEEELKVLCPFHRDTNPSCFININKKVFSCHTSGCERTGDIISLLAALLDKSRSSLITELSYKYTILEDDLTLLKRRHYEWKRKKENLMLKLDTINEMVKAYEDHSFLSSYSDQKYKYERYIKERDELKYHIDKITTVMNEIAVYHNAQLDKKEGN